MKVSRLLLDEFVSNAKNSVHNNRRIGTSTGIALDIISTAMLNPEVPVLIEESKGCARVRNEVLGGIVGALLTKLGFKYFRIDYTALTLTYYPFVDVEVEGF